MMNLVWVMKLKTKAMYAEGVLRPLGQMDLKEGEVVEIIFEPRKTDLEKKVDELDKYLAANAPKPFVSRLKKGYKWFTEEYSLKKLGLIQFPAML